MRARARARRYKLVGQLASHNSSLLTQAASVGNLQRAYHVHVQFERVLDRRTDELLAAAKAHREHLLGVQSRIRDKWRGGARQRADAAEDASHYENERERRAGAEAKAGAGVKCEEEADEDSAYATMKDAQEVSRMSQLQADLSALYELLNRRLVEFEFSARRTQEEVARVYRLYAELYRVAKWALAAMRRLYAPLAKLTQSPRSLRTRVDCAALHVFSVHSGFIEFFKLVSSCVHQHLTRSVV